MSPDQQIYSRVYSLILGLGYDTYSYLPGDVVYPFVHIGEQFKQNERLHKDRLNAQTQLTVHVWGNDWRRRGDITKMMYAIERAIVKEFGVRGEDISTQLITDNSTNTPLMHGIVDINITY